MIDLEGTAMRQVILFVSVYDGMRTRDVMHIDISKTKDMIGAFKKAVNQ